MATWKALAKIVRPLRLGPFIASPRESPLGSPWPVRLVGFRMTDVGLQIRRVATAGLPDAGVRSLAGKEKPVLAEGTGLFGGFLLFAVTCAARTAA